MGPCSTSGALTTLGSSSDVLLLNKLEFFDTAAARCLALPLLLLITRLREACELSTPLSQTFKEAMQRRKDDKASKLTSSKRESKHAIRHRKQMGFAACCSLACSLPCARSFDKFVSL
jgi:hypothetical protein